MDALRLKVDGARSPVRTAGKSGAGAGDFRGHICRAAGPIFVNPAYALDPHAAEDPAARRSLRFGVVMNGASSLEDRPIGLRLRQPSMRLSKYIENRSDLVAVDPGFPPAVHVRIWDGQSSTATVPYEREARE